MNRVITVKGIGKVSAKPDLIVLSMSLAIKNMDYEKTIEESAVAISQIQKSIVGIGFEKSDLKTTDYKVKTSYKSVHDLRNNYKDVFDGYECKHSLKLEFDFEMKKLAKVFSALAACPANPQFSVAFSVKDKNAVSEDLIVDAAENAKVKANILAKASGVTLGQIVNIDYSWGELHMCSDTGFEMRDALNRLRPGSLMEMDIEPDDIDVSDTVTFVWEIS